MNDETKAVLLNQHSDKLIEHDNIIKKLVFSVEQLVSTQADTNIELKKIATFLAKQAVFSTKLEDLESNLSESSSRLNKRISNIEETQSSVFGCSSVKLVNKDITRLTEDIDKLVVAVGSINTKVESVTHKQAEALSSSTIRWILVFVITYIVGFGVYVSNSINTTNNLIGNMNTKNVVYDKELSRLEHWIGFMENRNDRKRKK